VNRACEGTAKDKDICVNCFTYCLCAVALAPLLHHQPAALVRAQIEHPHGFCLGGLTAWRLHVTEHLSLPADQRREEGVLQNTANRLSKLRPHLKALFGLCERKFGHPDVIPLPPHDLHLRLPDLPVPKHDAHQRTRNSEPHVRHLLPSISWLLIGVSPRGLKSISEGRTSTV